MAKFGLLSFFSHDQRRERKEVVNGMAQRVADLDRELEATVEAMDRGDVDLADLAWENELAPEDHQPNR